MARFYSNENIALPVVIALRRIGNDVLTSLDAGKANSSIPDHEVLAFATADNRILISHNRKHFIKLHRLRDYDHAGIVVCSFNPSFVELGYRIDGAVSEVQDMRNVLIRVNLEDYSIDTGTPIIKSES